MHTLTPHPFPFFRLPCRSLRLFITISNQLGYTTPASAGRSSFYATDLAKAISAPILHVNGDRVDDVARAMRLAVAYQQYVLVSKA